MPRYAIIKKLNEQEFKLFELQEKVEAENFLRDLKQLYSSVSNVDFFVKEVIKKHLGA